ncbi:MAG: hypothetical protein ABIK15_16975 [Pseudomonadota bacterium]
MRNSNEICDKIHAVYPDLGECGIDVNVNFEEQNNAWAVHLRRGGRELKTYLEIDETDVCIDKEKCIGLGLQIAQLRDNIALL